MLGDRLEGAELHQLQVPAGQPDDLSECERQSLLQRIQQEVPQTLFTLAGSTVQLLRRLRFPVPDHCLRGASGIRQSPSSQHDRLDGAGAAGALPILSLDGYFPERPDSARRHSGCRFQLLHSVFGVVIAAIVLHERLTKFMIAGGILVLASTLLVTVYEEHQRLREPASVASAGE